MKTQGQQRGCGAHASKKGDNRHSWEVIFLPHPSPTAVQANSPLRSHLMQFMIELRAISATLEENTLYFASIGLE